MVELFTRLMLDTASEAGTVTIDWFEVIVPLDSSSRRPWRC